MRRPSPPCISMTFRCDVGTGYPAPHDVPCRQRGRRRLSDAFGLTQFGFNLLELPPGAWSSHRHWHERQDEIDLCP